MRLRALTHTDVYAVKAVGTEPGGGEGGGCARVSGAELFNSLSVPPPHPHPPGWLSADRLQMGLRGEGEEGERCGWEKWVTRAETESGGGVGGETEGDGGEGPLRELQ